MSFSEVDNEIRKLVAKLDLSGEVMRLQIDLLPVIANLLEQWLGFLPDQVLKSQIAALAAPAGEVINVAELPELVKNGNPAALKLLKALFPAPEGE
jgi:hypothetical protein